MKKLLVLFVLAGCSTTSNIRPDIKDYCGEVGPLSVYADRHNGFVSCTDAIVVSREAYTLLQQTVGSLKEPWDIEYTYKFLDIGTLAQTYSIDHVIKVREEKPTSIFHELLHAYLQETTLGKHDDHKTICSTHSWWTAEADFSEWPQYCYANGGVE